MRSVSWILTLLQCSWFYSLFRHVFKNVIPVAIFFNIVILFSGMWQWQNSSQASDSGPGSSGSSAGPPTGGPPGSQGPQGPGQPQELTDMLQMLQDQGGTTSFEDLNMFNTSFE